MPSEQLRRNGVLVLRIAQRALVRSPEWPVLNPDDGPGVAAVAFDLGQVDFVSSLFWQGCVEMSWRLGAEGRRLILLNLSDEQKRLLALIDGSNRLIVVDDEAELDGLGTPPRGRRAHDGVTGAEKSFLWD
ncbi:MAG: hypothetical protein PVJ27_02065 [Candidatus Brocadiaceae bacterium]|jgi:hypothetical protein